MYAIFMNRNLIHFNDREITDDEKDHSRSYHMYLGPMECKLSKFTTIPDTDDIRRILPFQIRAETKEFAAMIAQDETDRLEEALASVSISDYFSNDSTTFRSAFVKCEKARKAASAAAKCVQNAPAPFECFSE